MIKNKLILSVGFVFFSLLAQASVLDVCDLAKTPLTDVISAKMRSSQIKSYKEKLAKECELSSRFEALNEKLRSVSKVSLTDITEYQSIRFIQRAWLSRAERDQKPVEIIYQVFKDQYALSYQQQSGVVWDDWAVGIKQLEPVIESFKNGETFDLKALKKIHRGLFPFYPMVDEHGDFAHAPNPGVLKRTVTADSEAYWWLLENSAEAVSAQVVVQKENELYRRLGLTTPVPKGLPSDLGDIFYVRDIKARDGRQPVKALYSGSDVVNRQNIELILGMVDTLIKQARSGQHMIWKDTLFTPGQLAYFVQQIYVRVHPFYEGNGRTSRFLQELILLSFNMPHGASGDLMDIDVLTENEEYYQKAIKANLDLIGKMQQCSNEYDQVARKKDVRVIDQSRLSYGCRILEDRSVIWADMKYKNEVTNKISYTQRLAALAALDQSTDLGYVRELDLRRGAGRLTAVDPSLECQSMTGTERVRCENFVEIRKRIGK